VRPAWWIVFTRELRDLWVGGKALYLILIYTLLLGIYAYLFASNAELQLLPLKRMVLEIVKTSVAVGMFVCLMIGADSFSGERERGTLEALLLTPASRRQIVIGKFLAALSLWPVALAIGVPYWVVLSKGDPVLAPALLWGPLMGSLLAPAMVAVGMLVSLRCNSNTASLLLSIGLYLLLILPAELLGPPAGMPRSDALQWVNPLAASPRLLEESLVGNAPPHELWVWLTMPLLFAVVAPGVLFGLARRGVRLTAAPSRLRAFWSRWGRLVGVPAEPRSPRPGSLEQPHDPTAVSPVLTETQPYERKRHENAGRVTASRSGWTAWWLVCSRDLFELWIGGRALILLLVYVIVVGAASFVSVSNSQVDLIPPKEMVWTTLQTSIYVGVIMGVIVGADSLSGARERARLETLLLTPASRTQIVVGKFLAAMSPWPLALAVSVPFLALLAQGDAILGTALQWGILVGSLLVLGFTGMGMLVSFWSNSNRTSLFVSLTLYLLFLLPALLPGQAQKGLVGKFFQRSNPLAAADEFLEKVVVNNRSLADFGSWLKGPIVFPILVLVLLLLYAAPRLRLQAGRATLSRPFWGRVARPST
jgi:ABC-type transport system involved in multi-copper enzyme maturation permease subunit